jgi:hypothetical protein
MVKAYTMPGPETICPTLNPIVLLTVILVVPELNVAPESEATFFQSDSTVALELPPLMVKLPAAPRRVLGPAAFEYYCHWPDGS